MAGLATVDSIVIPDSMLENAGITLIKDTVTDIDSSQKTVTLADAREISFDKLLLANGASPFVPDIEGREFQGVFTLRSTPDALAMIEYMKTRQVKRLTLIGAGFIGLEVATLLKSAQPDLDITVVELLDYPLPQMLDQDMAAKVATYIEEQGIKLETGRKVVKISGENEFVNGVMLDSGDTIAADMVLMSVGVRSNLELARQAGLEIGTMGIKVNEYMETSHPDIFAAGDNVENLCLITGKPSLGQLRGIAITQGRLVAKRLAGAAIAFPGVLNNSCVKLFDLCAAGVGLTEKQAAQNNLPAAVFTVDSRSKHGMIEGTKPWTLKVIFNRDTRKVIGSQIVSMSEAPVKEIDTMNLAIKLGASPEDLFSINCAGHPDLSSEPSLEPIALVGAQASGKI